MLPESTRKTLVNLMHEIDKASRKMKAPSPTFMNSTEGLRLSKQVVQQPVEVNMSPYMKNMYKAFKDIKNTGDRITIHTPVSKAEKWLYDTQMKALSVYNPLHNKGRYDETKPLDHQHLYDADCFNNIKEPVKFRQIVPGMTEQIRENMSEYRSLLRSPKPLEKLINNDIVFQKMIEVILELLPSVRASTEFRQINLPFMTKHTNVGAPYYRNDKAIDSESGLTYAELTMQKAQTLTPKDLLKHNCALLLARFQGKGRNLIAVNRIVNLVLNQLESEEISAYKNKCSLFGGYNDDIKLQEILTIMLKDANSNNLKAYNFDQRLFDRHVSYDWILLLGAISIFKCNGSRSKDIAFARAVLATRSWIVDGDLQKVYEIFGRIFSGFIDTNAGGGKINAMITVYCLMLQNKEYSNWVYRLLYFMLVMGDDNLFLVDKTFSAERFIRDMSKLGFEVHSDKKQYGIFFLQNRIFKPEDMDETIMIYPWTRVLRSALQLEQSKGFGPWGWTMRTVQQLIKLRQHPKYFGIVVNILAHFDSNKLGLNHSYQTLIKGIQDEDKAAQAKDGKRYISTFDKIYDGDPTKARWVNDGEGFNENIGSQVFKMIKDVYDPSFFEKIGVKAPEVRFEP